MTSEWIYSMEFRGPKTLETGECPYGLEGWYIRCFSFSGTELDTYRIIDAMLLYMLFDWDM